LREVLGKTLNNENFKYKSWTESVRTMAGENTDYLTPNEVAGLLLVSPITVRQWAQKGLLEAQTTAGGHRRFAREEVARFARERGIDLPNQKRTVLVVDDDRQLNSYLVAVLETSVDDIEIVSALDGFAAGRMVQEHKPEIVLLDIMMPGMNGVEVCSSIKAAPETRHAMVIAMTGHHTPELERRVLDAGAKVLLKKPFSREELLNECGFSSLDSQSVASTKRRT
jgi:excisionase family DNA binding protein